MRARRFHMYATGITPAMVTPKVGKGTQYIAGMRDSEGRPFDGSKTYTVHLPPNVPANQFWAFTVYNVQTRSMLQTDQRFPEITSADGGVQQNADGSYDVYFGPEAARRQGEQLGADRARQGLAHALPPLRPGAGLVRQDLAAERDGVGGVTGDVLVRRGRDPCRRRSRIKVRSTS